MSLGRHPHKFFDRLLMRDHVWRGNPQVASPLASAQHLGMAALRGMGNP
jgi:hypothetical protein